MKGECAEGTAFVADGLGGGSLRGIVRSDRTIKIDEDIRSVVLSDVRIWGSVRCR
jgi:predicted butyrate kinase (DUF1464 family)